MITQEPSDSTSLLIATATALALNLCCQFQPCSANDVAQKNAPVAQKNAPSHTTVAKKKLAKDTAAAVNQIPGVKVAPTDLETQPKPPPITGFHPFKRLLRPVENLEGMSIRLQQQIMRLEGPVASLQPPMARLDNKMTTIHSQLRQMSSLLDGMQSQVVGVRSDLQGLKAEIAQLKIPLLSLQKPIVGVSSPLDALNAKLTYILISILVAGAGIMLGTPFAAVLLYRNRKKLLGKDTANEMDQEVNNAAAEANAGKEVKPELVPDAVGVTPEVKTDGKPVEAVSSVASDKATESKVPPG